jgi:CubicO group peptidase (beta-lactamase class C family)
MRLSGTSRVIVLILVMLCGTLAMALAASSSQGPVVKPAVTSPSVDFFVSPQGQDRWSGRQADPTGNDGPFATVGRARDAVRALLKSSREPRSVRVVLRGGTYNLEQPLEFRPEDSGTEETPIVYAAAVGEEVVLSGGRRITNGRWDQVYGLKVWATDLPDVKAGQWRFRQLFVNGERRPRTRLPKQGEYRIEALPDVPISNETWDTPVRRFVYAGTDIRPWHNLRDVEVVAPCRWLDNRLPILEVDSDKRMVTFDRSSRFNLVELYHTEPSTYWVENVLEALDSPGQWYLDRPLGLLYFLPAKDENPTATQMVAPRLAQLVRVVGRPDAPVRFLRFESLTFAHAEWEPPADWAASSQAATDVPGALFLTHASRCAVRQCRVEHVGTYAIEVGEGCQDVDISHNRLTDLGAGGVKLGHGSRRTTVADNEIGHAGRLFLSAVGIWVGHSAGNRIIHNHIHDLHYSGISVGWQWDFKTSQAVSNVIEHNHIHDLGHGLLSDMGGIYTLGVSPGTRLRYNVIYDIKARAYGGWGIYPDEGSSEIAIENNLAYRCSSSPFFAHINRRITVQNNIFAFGDQCQVERAGAMSGPDVEYTFRRNIVCYRQGQLVGYWDARNPNFSFERNLYWNVSGAPITFSGKSLAEWQAAGQDKNSLIADPLFVDAERGDFRLRPDSPAAQINFKPWDMSEVGPRPIVSSGNRAMVFPGKAWATATPESQTVRGAGLAAALAYLGITLKDYGGTGTVLIVRNGYVIWAGPESDKEHQIYSATKSFTSTALGLLVQDGKVSINTLAKDLEPALTEYYPTVTLRHFATMTSGYDSAGGSYEFDTQGRGDDWNPGPPAPPIFPPGSKFRYWDDAMSQFGSVLTKAAGQPLDQLFKSRIADPIGMTRWRWTENDTPTGRFLSWQGGIWTSSRELARFGHLFLNRGNWNGRQLIDASWVDQATTVQVPATVPNDTPPRSRGAGVYGYNWWVNGLKPDGQRLWPGAPPRTYYANGLHNNVCIVVPEWNLALARTNGGRKDGSANTPANVDEIWSGFFSRLAEAVGP